MRIALPLLSFLFILQGGTTIPSVYATPKEAMVLFGEPKYKPGFTHFDYVNPEAPKGGTLKLAYMASFDNLNPFILKGLPAPGLTYYYETLMVQSLDEPQTLYPLIARAYALAPDKTTITFYLNPKARFHDGSPITAEDVVFTYQALKEKGDPVYRMQYAPVAKAEALDARTVRFTFINGENRDIPVIMASLPVVSKRDFAGKDFSATTLTPPLASGPYRIAKVDPGRSILYRRDPDYWGKDLPVRRGYHNFDRIRFDAFRDDTVALEALKAHQFDLYEEFIARNWATSYNIPAVERGDLIKYAAPNHIPRGVQAFLFNTRKAKFADRRVREAISLTLDYEWLNHTIFYDAYKRTNSLFQNTPYAARELPSAAELKLMEPYRDSLPPEVFTQVYNPPQTNGTGFPRENLLRGQKLLEEAGWVIKDGMRVNAKTGEKLTIEIMVRQKTFDRVVGSMFRNLRKLGITGSFRLVDDAQYQKRLDKKDFDLISAWWNLGLVFPGSEQKVYWDSSQADIPGGQNQTGMKNKAVDAFLNKIMDAKTDDELRTASRALDRAIMWQHVMIPNWYVSTFRVAYWNIFERPKVAPTYGLGAETWWLKPEYRKRRGDQRLPEAQKEK